MTRNSVRWAVTLVAALSIVTATAVEGAAAAARKPPPPTTEPEPGPKATTMTARVEARPEYDEGLQFGPGVPGFCRLSDEDAQSPVTWIFVHLASEGTGVPLKPVTIDVRYWYGSSSVDVFSVRCEETTRSNPDTGSAACPVDWIAPDVEPHGSFTAAFAGDSDHLPSSTSGTF